jgi:hypothetical protein
MISVNPLREIVRHDFGPHREHSHQPDDSGSRGEVLQRVAADESQNYPIRLRQPVTIVDSSLMKILDKSGVQLWTPSSLITSRTAPCPERK